MEGNSESEHRTKILKEAIEIVYREGVDRITMRGLAARLGHSPAVIYQHFRSKEELVREIALHGFECLAEAVIPAFRLEDPRQALAEWGRRYIQFGLGHQALYRLMFQDLHPIWQAVPNDVPSVARMWEAFQKIHSRGVESGAFLPHPPETLAGLSWAMMHGFVQLVTSNRLPNPTIGLELEPIREALVDALVRAVRPEIGPSP